VKGIHHFTSTKGKETLLKGVKKIKLDRCFDSEFQSKAVAWVDARARTASVNAILAPVTTPQDLPSSSIAYVGYDDRSALDVLPLDVDVEDDYEEELMDLIDTDE
jgi:hypothetical protein